VHTPLVFTHIPRTAGTSLREAVSSSLGLEVDVDGFGGAMLGTFTDLNSVHPSIRSRIVTDPSDLPADARFVSGHISPSTTLARFPDADHFTVLREPRARLISNWLFARAHSDFNLRRWGGLAAWMRAARTGLVDYIDNPLVAAHVDNGIARLLLWPHDLIPNDDFIDPRHDDRLFEDAVAVLATIDQVGVVENPDWVAELGTWLGRPLSLQKLNGAKRLQQPDLPDLDAEVSGTGADVLRTRTRIDARLWDHVAARTFADTEEVRERAFNNALERYSVQLPDAGRLSYPRRIVERSYSIARRAITPGARSGT
jgi:hypothetical protein